MGKDEEVATDFAEWIRPKPKCLLGVKLVGAGGASGREDIKENLKKEKAVGRIRCMPVKV